MRPYAISCLLAATLLSAQNAAAQSGARATTPGFVAISQSLAALGAAGAVAALVTLTYR